MDTKTLSVKFPLGTKVIILDVELIVSTILANEEKTVSIKTKALIDTGANGSCISSRLASACQLHPISAMKMISAHGMSVAQVYEVSMKLQNDIQFSSIPVVEISGSKAFDIIIGMDILNKCDFAFSSDNSNSCFSMRIPSAKTIIELEK